MNARPFSLRLAVVACGALLATAAAHAQPKPAAASSASAAGAAVTTASGLVYRSVREGSGTSPTAADRVKVHYRGTLTDGTEFDSSYRRGEPAVFPLGRVIKCWTEGLQRMKPGGKAELVCPPDLGYGARSPGGLIPANSTLKFEVELLEVLPPA